MKIFNKILAMVLALLTVLVMLPVSAFADAWLDVTAQTKAENSKITVTVNAAELAAILKNNGISKTLLKEILGSTDLDTDALKQVFTTEELLEIVPLKDLLELINPAEIVEQLDTDVLLGYIDVRALLANVDLQALLDLLPDDVDLGTIADLGALVGAVDVAYVLDKGYVDVDGLAAALMAVLSTSELVDLAGDNLTDVVDFDLLFKAEKVTLTADVVSFAEIKNAGLITNSLTQSLIDAGAFELTKLETYFKSLENAKDYFDATAVKGKIEIADYIDGFDYTGFHIDLDAFVEEDIDQSKFDADDYEIDAEGNVTLTEAARELIKSDPTEYLTDAGMTKLEGMVNIDDVYAQIDVKDILVHEEMSTLASCIKLDKALRELDLTTYINYGPLVSTIGVNNIIHNENITVNYDAIDLSGVTSISDYLTEDYIDYIDDVALVEVAEENDIDLLDYVDDDAVFADDYIMSSVDLEDAVDVEAFLDAVDMDALLNLIGTNAILAQLDRAEMLEILSTIDIQSYIQPVAVLVIGKLLTNVDQITMDGTVIAGENKTTAQLELYAGNLAKALLKKIPTLDDIANIENNVVFSTTFGLLYTVDANATANAGKVKAKNITVEFVLEGDLSKVKNAAAELEALLKKYIDFDVAADGSIYVGIELPTVATPDMLTTLYKKALASDKLDDAVKLKLLDLVNTDGNEVVGFVDSLTMQDLVAILDAVEPSALYDSFLNISYVEAALEKVSGKIGYDLSSVTLDDMKNVIANVPSIDRICEIVENKTGRDVMAILENAAAKVDGLTQKAAVQKLLNILEEKTGYNFDISVAEVLDRAADVEISKAIADLAAKKIGVNVRDVLNSYSVDELWAAAVDKVATKEGAYNKVKNYLVVIADYLPESVMSVCIADLYQGNGVFSVDKLTVSFSEQALAKTVLTKLFKGASNIDVLAEKLASKLGVSIAVAESVLNKIDTAMDRVFTEGMLDKLLGYVPNGTITGSLSFGVQFTDVYQITYMDRDGETTLFSAFLPVGADLSIFKTDSAITGYDIADWTDAEGNPVLTMPAADTVVYADRNAIEVVFEDVDGTVLESLLLKSGDKLTAEMLDAITAKVTTGEVQEKLFDKYNIAWLNADGETVDMTQPITESITVKANATPNYYFDLEGYNWTIEYIEGLYRLTIHDELPEAIELDLLRQYILADAAVFENDGEDHEDIRLEVVFDNGNANAADDFAFLFFDNANLKALYANSADGDEVAFSYNTLDTVENAIYGGVEGAGFYNFDILVNGDVQATDFANAKMTITLPYANATTNTASGAETRVHVVTATGRELVEATVNVTAGMVTFDAPHFSQFVISNEYELVVEFKDSANNTVNDCTIINPDDMYFPAETVLKMDDIFEVPAKYEIETITADKGTVSADLSTFTMPADSGATITVVIKAATYHIYYIVNGIVYQTVDYNANDGVPAILPFVNSTDSKFQAPAHYTAQGGKWVGYNATQLGNQYVFAQWTAVEYTVKFVAGSTTITDTFTFDTYKDVVAPAVPANNAGQVGKWDYTDLATELQKAFTDANKTATINAVYSNRLYAIAGDGVVTVEDQAEAGASVNVTAPEQTGYNAIISVVDGNGDEVTVTDGAFTMPAVNVYVSVSYEAKDITYTENGVSKTGKFDATISVVIPVANGELIAQAPAGCTLVSYTTNPDGSAVATYAFVLNAEGISIEWNTVGNAVTPFYIFNGNMSTSNEAPTSNIENVKFAGWTEAVAGLSFATFTVETETNLLWLWIVLIILAVILLIALIYTLYINGKLKPNFITRFVTWLVTLFFNLCLAVAAAGLWIAHLFGKSDDPAEFGVKEEEETAEETTEEATEETAEEATEETEASEEDIQNAVAAALAADAVTEEVTEETAEEATEEVAEEAAAEVAEEAAEETDEEATEEVAEEATEEVVEEATEEVVEEATEEVAEEATEEVAEEATEETAEEATEEVAEEATEETAEEATEEVVEEATEETAEEATEETAEEATEETAEEATEETAEEATEETAEEATEEVAEEATEETAEEATEETAEEATEETAEEATEEAEDDKNRQ